MLLETDDPYVPNDLFSEKVRVTLLPYVRPVGGVEDADGVDDARPSVLYVPTGQYGPSVASTSQTTIDAPSVDDLSAPTSSRLNHE